jgi:hypothetical protein
MFATKKPDTKKRKHFFCKCNLLSIFSFSFVTCRSFPPAVNATAEYKRARGFAEEKNITICSIKRKENFFSLFLAREQKNSGKKFFLFMGHEVLFYETSFLHRARRNYVCGACETTAD